MVIVYNPTKQPGAIFPHAPSQNHLKKLLCFVLWLTLTSPTLEQSPQYPFGRFFLGMLRVLLVRTKFGKRFAMATVLSEALEEAPARSHNIKRVEDLMSSQHGAEKQLWKTATKKRKSMGKGD